MPPSHDDLSPQRARALDLLRNYGAHGTSFQVLEAGIDAWFDPDGQGMVGYVSDGLARVVAGPPIAPSEHTAALLDRFARDDWRPPLIFSGDDALLDTLQRADHPADAVVIGEQPEWDPQDWTLQGSTHRSLRAQVRRAGNKGVTAARIPALDTPTRDAITAILSAWHDARTMSVMGFMVDVQPFFASHTRRYYLATQDDRPVAFLIAVPVFARKGWFFEDVIRLPDAPNGTTELLIHTAMEDIKADGARYATLGLAPLSGIPSGPGPHRLTRAALRACYATLGPLYGFQSLRAFKQRFRPHRWAPQYLVAPRGRAHLLAFLPVLRVFARGRLLAFALDTARRLARRAPARLWALGCAALAASVLPWIVALAWTDAARWLDSAPQRYAWITFDTLTALALAALAVLIARERPIARPASRLVAALTGLNLALMTLQACALSAPPAGWSWLGLTSALIGPLIATGFLTLASRALTPAPSA